MNPEERAQRLARKQGGHLTVRQALSCGMSHRQIQWRREKAGWTRVLPDVYRLPGVAGTLEGFLHAVQLWMGDDGFFVGATAAGLYGLDGITSPE